MTNENEKEMFKMLHARHVKRMQTRAAKVYFPDADHPREARPEFEYLGNGNYRARALIRPNTIYES